MEVCKLLEKVNDQKSFLDFAKVLLKDKIDDTIQEEKKTSSPFSSSSNGWENLTIEGYLEAAIAWADDSNFGKNQNIKDNLWYQFATFLYCGKIYE